MSEKINTWTIELGKLPTDCPIASARKEGQTYAFCEKHVGDGCAVCIASIVKDGMQE